MALETYNLTFTKQMEQQPIIYNLGRKFNLITTIEKAAVNEEAGWMQVSFSGDRDEIQRAIADLSTIGVFITPPELSFLK